MTRLSTLSRCDCGEDSFEDVSATEGADWFESDVSVAPEVLSAPAVTVVAPRGAPALPARRWSLRLRSTRHESATSAPYPYRVETVTSHATDPVMVAHSMSL